MIKSFSRSVLSWSLASLRSLYYRGKYSKSTLCITENYNFAYRSFSDLSLCTSEVFSSNKSRKCLSGFISVPLMWLEPLPINRLVGLLKHSYLIWQTNENCTCCSIDMKEVEEKVYSVIRLPIVVGIIIDVYTSNSTLSVLLGWKH